MYHYRFLCFFAAQDPVFYLATWSVIPASVSNEDATDRAIGNKVHSPNQLFGFLPNKARAFCNASTAAGLEVEASSWSINASR